MTQKYPDAINVQALTPVIKVTSQPDGSSHTVYTERGSIKASKVIYTTNAYTRGLLPEYAANIIPCRAKCCHITTPKPAPFLPYSYIIFTEDGKAYSYLTTRPDGSIIVGPATRVFTDPSERKDWFNIIDDSQVVDPPREYYDNYMQRTFKGWEDSGASVKEMWCGSM